MDLKIEPADIAVIDLPRGDHGGGSKGSGYSSLNGKAAVCGEKGQRSEAKLGEIWGAVPRSRNCGTRV